MSYYFERTLTLTRVDIFSMFHTLCSDDGDDDVDTNIEKQVSYSTLNLLSTIYSLYKVIHE